MQNHRQSLFNLAVIAGALGYFVDIYDLLLFSIVRVPSLKSLGLGYAEVAKVGLRILNVQMIGLLIGGICWGILGDKKGRLKVLFASIFLYSIGNIANGFVHSVGQYELVRFVTGLGLAGELGAGITLVCELMPKQTRGIATSLVAGIGLTGAVFAYFVRQQFVSPDGSGWRTCYFIGGGLGFLLLFFRMGVLESGMFDSLSGTSNVRKGDFFMLFTSPARIKKYLTAILIALPNWFVIGILISFADKFALSMNIVGKIDPGKAVMVSYVAISIGDVLIGLISQTLKSRKKALLLFYVITAMAALWFFNLQGKSTNLMYWVIAMLGFGTGFWAMFVTMAAEQFGTNIRATVATTAPNMARGSLVLVSAVFSALQSRFSYFESGWLTAIIVITVGSISLAMTEETFGKDLDYVERA